MVTVTCKCGKQSKTFKNLTEEDFKDGWEYECCKKSLEAKKEESKEIAPQKSKKKRSAKKTRSKKAKTSSGVSKLRRGQSDERQDR